MDKSNRFELNAGFTFEAVEVMADALKRAQSADPAAIHAALKATRIEDHIMYGGTIQFDAKGQNPNIGVALLQNRNGVPTVVGPQQVMVTAPTFPMRPFNERS